MHDFKTPDGTTRCPKRFEAEHGTRETFHCSMILLHNIIQILGVANDDSGLVCLVVVRDCCRIRATLIDSDFFWEPLSANGFT